jgi:hypothetical protein
MLRKLTFALLFQLAAAAHTRLEAQIYVDLYDLQTFGVSTFDLCSCSTTSLYTTPAVVSGLAAAPGFVYHMSLDTVFRYNTATGAVSLVAILPGDAVPLSVTIGPGVLLYTAGQGSNPQEEVFSVNPNTGAVTSLGFLPLDMGLQGDLFVYNGQIYGLASYNGNSAIIQIPINNPSAASVVFSMPQQGNIYAAFTIFYNGVETPFFYGYDSATFQGGLFALNMVTGQYYVVCPYFAAGDLAAVAGTSVSGCCFNDAGTFLFEGLETACANEALTIPPTYYEAIEPGSTRSYILVADTMSNLPNGILQTTTTPTFTFNPATMTIGTTYYVAAVVAPGPAGAPNWAAPCKDVSYFTPIKWLPLPSVALDGPAPEVCGATACLDYPLVFTGSPPFSLTWQMVANNQAITGIFTTPANTGLLTICPPVGGFLFGSTYTLQFVGFRIWGAHALRYCIFR